MSRGGLLAGIFAVIAVTIAMWAASTDWGPPESDHTYNPTMCAHLAAVAVGEGFPPGVSEDAAVEHSLHC